MKTFQGCFFLQASESQQSRTSGSLCFNVYRGSSIDQGINCLRVLLPGQYNDVVLEFLYSMTLLKQKKNFFLNLSMTKGAKNLQKSATQNQFLGTLLLITILVYMIKLDISKKRKCVFVLLKKKN